MADAIARMATHYERVGLATPSETIAARQEMARAVAKTLKLKDLPDLVRCVLGLKLSTDTPTFLTATAESGLTEIRAADVEAGLFASALAGVLLTSKGRVAEVLALTLVTASVGNLRKPSVDEHLLTEADDALIAAQSAQNAMPTDRTYAGQPKPLKEAIEAVRASGNLGNATAHTDVVGALESLGKYAESNAMASAANDNQILKYAQQLQNELYIYWWVTAAWSVSGNRAFKDLSPAHAALRAGAELAAKDSSSAGLFPAPALLDMVVTRGRTTKMKTATLAAAAIEPERDWRRENFTNAATGDFADLVPITAALGLAADSQDESDWLPRFRRLTALDPNKSFAPIDLGVQLYREQVLLRALAT